MKKTIAIFICLFVLSLRSCSKIREDKYMFSVPDSSVRDLLSLNETSPTKDEIKIDPKDPYSYVIKEKYDEFGEWYGKDGERPIQHYFLYDIDGNGIEELLIGTPYVVGGIDNVEPPYESRIMLKEIYTIKNGEVVELSTVSWWDEMFIFDKEILNNGLICYISVFEDEYDYFYWSLDDTEMVFRELSSDEGKYTYRYLNNEMIKEINSDKTGINLEMELYRRAKVKEITPEEFDRLRAEIEGDAKPVEIEWKNIEQYGR